MAKKIKAFIKLALPAGKTTPAPPVGPALGQHTSACVALNTTSLSTNSSLPARSCMASR